MLIDLNTMNVEEVYKKLKNYKEKRELENGSSYGMTYKDVAVILDIYKDGDTWSEEIYQVVHEIYEIFIELKLVRHNEDGMLWWS